MNQTTSVQRCQSRPNQQGRERLLAVAGEPLFIADWDRALMLHYQVDRRALQAEVPFDLDLWRGGAFVTLVAFTLRGMRPRIGGLFTELLLRPIATHAFLNVRTYVTNREEPGIFFLAEWLPNRISVAMGPRFFGLPYRLGKLEYEHRWEHGTLRGQVRDFWAHGLLRYEATLNSSAVFAECQPGSRSEWLMERYTAFTQTRNKKRCFRVWHPPWSQVSLDAKITERSLLDSNWPFLRHARYVGANFSPGLSDVLMGRPQRAAALL